MGQPFCKRLLQRFVIMLGLVLCSQAAHADELMWNGFFSTGLVFSDQSIPYNDTIDKSPDIIDETVLGLNLAKDLTQDLRMAAQFLASQRNADSALKADWAFLTYSPIESVELTLGKQKLPMWMASAYLDVGAVYPWAHPPEEVYLLFPLKTFTGASLGYAVDLGPTKLAIEPYAGEALMEVTPSAPSEHSKSDASHMFGTTINWTWDKTVARVSYNRAKWDLNFGPTVDLGERRFELLAYGLRSAWSNLLFMAEYVSTKDLDEQKYQDLSKEKAAESAAAAARNDPEAAGQLAIQSLVYSFRLGGSKAYYLTTGYQFADISLYLTYANLSKTPIEGATEDQNSLALGVNIDPDETSVLKFETKRIAVPDESRGLFKDPSIEERKDLDGTMIYSVTYSLLF